MFIDMLIVLGSCGIMFVHDQRARTIENVM